MVPFSVFSAAHVQSMVEDLHGTSFSMDASLPVEINHRLSVVEEVALNNVRRVGQDRLVASEKLMHAAQSAKTAAKKIIWIARSADAFNDAYYKQSACKSGCSHCCHIPVAVSKHEAHLISQSTGRELSSKRGDVNLSAGYNNPCPFLRSDSTAGGCAIYEVRPIACRLHLNMDEDDLLCRLIPGAQVPVPYADKRPILAAVMSMFPNDEYADVREWFRA